MEEIISTLVVEDDPLNIALVEALLRKYFPEIELVGVASNAPEFIDLYYEKKPDLILLDIHLGDGTDGLDILKEIQVLDAEIIIMSADDSHAIKAINEHQVAGYMTKPIGVFQLKRVITTAAQNLKLKKTANNAIPGLSEKLIAISTTTSIEFLMVRDILYLEADGKYTVFHLTSGGMKVVSKNIGEYEKIMPSQAFYRIHHKFIVNLQKVKTISKTEGSYCQLVNGISLPIAKRRHDSLRKFLNI